MVPRLAASVVALVVLIGVLGPTGLASARCWSPPVTAPIRDPFREPGCPWCPGNRGIEYATTAGQVAVAVATGRVSFAGAVAGTDYVVVEVADGRRVTYGRLLGVRHEVGDLLVRGQAVGRVDARFHLGVRVGDRYVDPAPLLGRWVGRPRLVPVDGSPPAASPVPVLRCRSAASVAGGTGGSDGVIDRVAGSMAGRFTVR